MTLNGQRLVGGTDYAVFFANNVNAGEASVAVTGAGGYTGSATASFTIAKANNTLKVTAKSKRLKAKSLKKKAVKAKKLVVAKNAKGTVAYKNASKTKALKKFKVDAKAGTLTIPKALKKGTYKVKVKVTAAGNSNFKASTKTVTVKVIVK